MDTSTFSTFNVGELTPIPGIDAVRLSRYPSRLETSYLTPAGKLNSRTSVGCEIRLVPECERTLFRVSSPDRIQLDVYQGDFWLQSATLDPGCWTEVLVEQRPRLLDLPEAARKDMRFSPEVLRLRVPGGTLFLHDIDTFGYGSRLPTPEEVPAIRWLAWGSSITQCDKYGYVHQAAERLRVDVLNKGMSGSCGVEPEVAAWHCEQDSWDFATVEWGVNIRGSVEPDEFKRRIDGCLEHFMATGKPVFLITVFPNNVHLGLDNPDVIRRQNAYDNLLREAAEQAPDQVRLIEGSDVLQRWTWLTGDLVHPTHEGHSLMGEQLANLLRPHLRDLLGNP
jgi:hypothetical protein